MADTRKQIAFDLDTKALKIYYPAKSWNNAYEVIRNHMTSNDFRWLQGSVYVSEKPMKPYLVTRILNELVEKKSMAQCMYERLQRDKYRQGA